MPSQLLAASADHGKYWVKPPGDQSTLAHPQVPIYNGKHRWGTLEVSFVEAQETWLERFWQHPVVQFLAFIGVVGFLLYLLFMRKTLEFLDPSAVIPERVKAAFDALSEGILLLDNQERTVLANEAFTEKVGHPDKRSMTGVRPSQLRWHAAGLPDDFPWIVTQRDNEPQQDVPMELTTASGEQIKFMVNTSPIADDKGHVRGVLASFDDVTALDAANTHLLALVQELEVSKHEIASKNEELVQLATRDPLTSCLNRRSFFEAVEALFLAARRSGGALSCIMADIDHFKSFNDRYGHSVGDQVIQVVATTLRAGMRNDDLLCRYGGEEFCLVLPDVSIEEATEIAERLRECVESSAASSLRTTQSLKITASFGVSALTFGAVDPAGLIDQADAALYASKQSGRNRVTRWDQMQEAPTIQQIA